LIEGNRRKFMQSVTHASEFAHSARQTASLSKKRVWAGRIISALAILFLLFDAIAKLMKVAPVLEASARLGLPAYLIVGIGSLLFVCVVIYAIPGTCTLGAILLTGYLGGAVATHVRVSDSLFETLFPVIFGVLIWAGIFLRGDHLRILIPLRK
jgi:hypothetical protein